MNIKTSRQFWKRILRWGIAGIFLIPAGLLSGAAVLNYTGYCLEQSCYLSDKELILDGVQAELGYYPSIQFAYDELPEAGEQIIQSGSRLDASKKLIAQGR